MNAGMFHDGRAAAHDANKDNNPAREVTSNMREMCVVLRSALDHLREGPGLLADPAATMRHS